MVFSRLAAAAIITAGTLAMGGCNRSGAEQGVTAAGPGSSLGPEATATASLAPADASGGAAGAALPLTAQAFVDAATSSDLYEMGAAKLADTATHPTAVRSFAQMMLRDHARSSDALKAAVASSNTSAQIDTQTMMPEHRAMLDELKAATPDQFAAVYARQQVTAHEKTLAVLQTYAQSGDSQPLMAFAAKTAPVVEHHLAEARKLPQ